MKSTHTPTPWLVRFDEDRFDSKLSVLEVVDGSDASLNHPQGELVLARVNVSAFAPHMDEPLANACLIASAPDLLAALETSIEMLSECMRTSRSNDEADAIDAVLSFANAAIAKAKGEQ